jgi:hypothetical protein
MLLMLFIIVITIATMVMMARMAMMAMMMLKLVVKMQTHGVKKRSTARFPNLHSSFCMTKHVWYSFHTKKKANWLNTHPLGREMTGQKGNNECCRSSRRNKTAFQGLLSCSFRKNFKKPTHTMIWATKATQNQALDKPSTALSEKSGNTSPGPGIHG